MSTGMDAAMHSGYATRGPTTIATLIADRWWTLVVRGVAAIGFGIFTLIAPRTSLLAIVFVFGAYALIDGIVHMMSAWRNNRSERGWLLFEGLVSIAVGVVAFAWTELTALWLLMLIGAWAVLTGIAKIAAAYRLRRELEGEWLLATSGVLSIVFGVVLFVAPGAGLVALLWIIGVYAVVFGFMLIGLGLRLRSWRSTATPTGAVPSGA